PLPEDRLKAMHTTMQTLGRVAIIGGGLLVALLNVSLLGGVASLPEAEKVATYVLIHEVALVIPVVSVSGVFFALWLQRRQRRQLLASGLSAAQADDRLEVHVDRPPVNVWVLGGGAAFAALSLTVGLGQFPFAQEIVFAVSMTIILALIWRLTRELDPR